LAAASSAGLEAMTVFKSSFALQFSATQSIGSLLFTATHKFLLLQLVAVCSAGQRNAATHLAAVAFSLPPSVRDCNEGDSTCSLCSSVALLYASSRDKRVEIR